MIVSMTGFGNAKKELDNFSVIAEIKTVNHRFCEINLRMPRQLLVIEDKIKKVVTEYVRRGRVEVFLTVEGEGLVKKSIRIDWELMDSLFQSIKQIQSKYHVTDEITTQQLIALEHILTIEEKEMENQELVGTVLEVIHNALVELENMRKIEGEKLLESIVLYLNGIELNVNYIFEHAPTVVNQYRERIRKRVAEFTEHDFEDNRILTEIAIFAEKADISEEITRLHSHINQFRETLQSTDSIGRKLDFIVQEMNREINTIGSKAQNSTIAKYVVEVKSLLEKIKEQVQNIE